VAGKEFVYIEVLEGTWLDFSYSFAATNWPKDFVTIQSYIYHHYRRLYTQSINLLVGP
jgi:hypothetical protein